jgi:hypothetical protein
MPAQLAHHLVELAVEVDAGMHRPFRRRQAEQIHLLLPQLVPHHDGTLDLSGVLERLPVRPVDQFPGGR